MHGKTASADFILKKIRKLKNNSNITPELLEAVERYDSDAMAKEERMAFEERLKDPSFKLLVEDIRITLLGIETQVLKERMDEFHNDMIENPTVKPHSTKTSILSFSKIALAAGIIIALGVFWIFSGSSNDRLYAKYFKPDPGLPTTMSSSDNFAFYEAMVNYKQKDYQTAISKWKKLDQKTPDNDTITYFLGVANLANNNSDDAVFYLKKTIHHPESVFLEDAQYYLGLAYLKSDNTEAAIRAFEQSNSEKSQELLRELN